MTFKLATSLLCFFCARSWGFEGVSTHFPLASYLFAELTLSFPINSGCDRDSPTLHHHFLFVLKVSLHPVLGGMPGHVPLSEGMRARGSISMMCSGQLVCGLCSKGHLSDGSLSLPVFAQVSLIFFLFCLFAVKCCQSQTPV